MKRRCTGYLKFESPIPLDQYSKVIFMFKQKKREDYPSLFTIEYPGNDVTTNPENNLFIIRLSSEQTALFEQDKKFYVDVHPYLTNGDEPAVSIFELYMEQTLYQEEDLR